MDDGFRNGIKYYSITLQSLRNAFNKLHYHNVYISYAHIFVNKNCYDYYFYFSS